ncbi:hypothetical protein JIN84_02360 [Luteolibacter yonseiensis]|uniref:Chromosome partition protein Smc n=1 Tax=Luteolibacter yonseiensis TaxID=1144680 RepID=A0A934R1J1_9BACT|nr:hypothetical protein [Luteolibacter yonseiensis]MBK1814438.1 hypothetical protein [Luteolibacter yonseiensis]
MKATFYVVAILAACGAAFFSFNQSNKFKSINKVHDEAVSSHATATAELTTTDKAITEEKAVIAAAQEKQGLLTQSVSSLKSTETSLKSESVKLDADLKTQEAEFAQVQVALDQVKKALETIGGDVTIETLPGKIQEIEDDKTAKTKKLEELTTLADGAEKNLVNSRAELDRLAKRLVERNSRIGRNSMEAVVTAVNQDWGFLVIGAGSNSGFSPQTTLLVERDGQKIGRVRPSSIEPTQTIAEIDLESLSAGVRVQPGDRVILAEPASN